MAHPEFAYLAADFPLIELAFTNVGLQIGTGIAPGTRSAVGVFLTDTLLGRVTFPGFTLQINAATFPHRLRARHIADPADLSVLRAPLGAML